MKQAPSAEEVAALIAELRAMAEHVLNWNDEMFQHDAYCEGEDNEIGVCSCSDRQMNALLDRAADALAALESAREADARRLDLLDADYVGAALRNDPKRRLLLGWAPGHLRYAIDSYAAENSIDLAWPGPANDVSSQPAATLPQSQDVPQK